MAHMGRPGLSAVQKADLWQRWKQGQSLSEIGRALGKHAGSIHGVVSSNGGFIPAVRRRSRRALTSAEREEISRGLAVDRSIRQIAARHRVAPVRDQDRKLAPGPFQRQLDFPRMAGIGMFDDVVQRLGNDDFGGAAGIVGQAAQQPGRAGLLQGLPHRPGP